MDARQTWRPSCEQGTANKDPGSHGLGCRIPDRRLHHCSVSILRDVLIHRHTLNTMLPLRQPQSIPKNCAHDGYGRLEESSLQPNRRTERYVKTRDSTDGPACLGGFDESVGWFTNTDRPLSRFVLSRKCSSIQPAKSLSHTLTDAQESLFSAINCK